MLDGIQTSDGGSSSYYDLPAGAETLDDLLEDMEWRQANIFKAAYRWRKKPDLAYNLRKIIWFAQRELDKLTGETSDRSIDNDVRQCDTTRTVSSQQAGTAHPLKDCGCLNCMRARDAGEADYRIVD